MTIVVHSELERIFGPGATRLALEYQVLFVEDGLGTSEDGQDDREAPTEVDERDFEDICDNSQSGELVASTPKERRLSRC